MSTQGMVTQRRNAFEQAEQRMASMRLALKSQSSAQSWGSAAHPAKSRPRNLGESPFTTSSMSGKAASIQLSPGVPTLPLQLPVGCRPAVATELDFEQATVAGAAFGQAPPLSRQSDQFGAAALRNLVGETVDEKVEQPKNPKEQKEKGKKKTDRKPRKASPSESDGGLFGFLNIFSSAKESSTKISQGEYAARVFIIRKGPDALTYFWDGVVNGHMNLRPLDVYLAEKKSSRVHGH
mmetsp:Transcript_25573/g.51187  ORF Transcript_25573/g.51187 Transcript_25573/m.51187 type:complete len:237 (+) Transcript_25573:2-712(+)